MSDSPKRVEAKDRILTAARALLDGKLDTLKASSEIARCRHDLDPNQTDPDLLAFAGIESQVDHLLMASLEGWHPSVREQKEAEYSEAERFFRAGALESARALVLRYHRPA
jgi:hypothetical protein